jgi:hypothetical protein
MILIFNFISLRLIPEKYITYIDKDFIDAHNVIVKYVNDYYKNQKLNI